MFPGYRSQDCMDLIRNLTPLNILSKTQENDDDYYKIDDYHRYPPDWHVFLVLTLTLPSPYVGMGGSLTVTVA